MSFMSKSRSAMMALRTEEEDEALALDRLDGGVEEEVSRPVRTMVMTKIDLATQFTNSQLGTEMISQFAHNSTFHNASEFYCQSHMMLIHMVTNIQNA